MKDPNFPNCDCPCHTKNVDYCICGCRVHYGTAEKDADIILNKSMNPQEDEDRQTDVGMTKTKSIRVRKLV